jgi:ankyrin repeat protein
MALLVSSDHPAAAGVQGELVTLLCAHGANPNGLDEDGLPLATAVAFGKVQAVDALGALARVDNALFAAATERLDLLAREIGPDGRLRDGAGHCRVPWLPMARDPKTAAEQALGVGAKLGRTRSVRWLLERGVDPNAAPTRGVTPLHEASYGGHLDVVRVLVEHGANPGLREETYRATALGWATEGKRHDVLAYLLEHHAPDVFDCVDLNLPEPLGRHLARDPSLVDAPAGRGNLLRWAAHTGFTEIVRVLLEHGANRALRDGDGRTALDRARAGRHAEVVKLLEDGAES